MAATTTDRLRPSTPRSRSMNSLTSRPRSPISPTTATSAEVLRAIMDKRVDLPTPEPAKIPIRWPLPMVIKPLMDLTPTSTGLLILGRSRGFMSPP